VRDPLPNVAHTMSIPQSVDNEDDFEVSRKYDTRINEGSDYQQMMIIPDNEEFSKDVRLGPNENAGQVVPQPVEESLIEKKKRKFSFARQIPNKQPELKKNSSIIAKVPSDIDQWLNEPFKMSTNDDDDDQSTNSDDTEQGEKAGLATKIGELIGNRLGKQAKKKKNNLGKIPKEDI
jgi:hypothetical protein